MRLIHNRTNRNGTGYYVETEGEKTTGFFVDTVKGRLQRVIETDLTGVPAEHLLSEFFDRVHSALKNGVVQ